MTSLRLLLVMACAACGGAVDPEPVVVGSASPSQAAPGATVTVNLTIDNFILVDPVENTEPTDGEGHYHVYLDEVGPDTLLAIDFRESITVVLPDDLVPNTIHKLIVTLRENNHDERQPNVRDDITIEVVAP